MSSLTRITDQNDHIVRYSTLLSVHPYSLCVTILTSVLGCVGVPASSPTEPRHFGRGAPAVHFGMQREDGPNGYKPVTVSCPRVIPTVRSATALSPQETTWLKLRDNNTVSALVDVLDRAGVTGMDVKAYIQHILDSQGIVPRIGIALSGGGYRALMNGAGALAAFDNRTSGATGPGHIGGILQAATYLSGLSGGSWLVGSLYVQNFTTVESITRATQGFLSQLWQFNQTIIEGLFASVSTLRSFAHRSSLISRSCNTLSWEILPSTL